MTSPTHVLITELGMKFYESSRKSAEDMISHGCTFSFMQWDEYAWPGGYPIYYVTVDQGVLCPDCANENVRLTLDKDYDQWYIVAQDINYEDQDLICDNCYKKIPSAYEEE